MTAISNYLESNYDVLVNVAPYITGAGFISFYILMHYILIKSGEGSRLFTWAFSLLLIALLPNFIAHATLLVVHGAVAPFVVEIINILPVVTYIILNEYYIRKNG